jgi:signal transduction histidine kinase
MSEPSRTPLFQKPAGVRRRLVASAVGLCIGLALLLSVPLVWQVDDTVRRAEAARAERLAHYLALTVRLGVLAEDESFFVEALDGAAAEPGIRYVAVLTADGKVVGRRGDPRTPNTRLFAAPVKARGEGDEVRTIGTVEVGLSDEAVLSERRKLIRASALAAFAALLVGSLLALFGAVRFTRPIRDLADAAKIFGAGRWELRVREEEYAARELKLLAREFNFMAERLAAHNRELEEKVKERTEALQRAYDELKELDRLKDEFVATVSHDLRSPLAIIKSSAQSVLRDRVMAEDVRADFLQAIVRHANRLTHLVESLLDLARIEARGIRTEPVRVEEVALAAAEAQRARYRERGVELAVTVPPGGAEAVVDKSRIDQAVTNLLDNALKFTPAGGKVELRIAAEAGGAHFSIEVEDTGSGIPAEHLPRIGEKFFRVERPGREVEGAGLGLALVKEIAERHGGKMRVTSEVDRGTTVSLRLPRAA